MNATWIIYVIPMLAIWAWYLRKRSVAEKHSIEAQKDAQAAGLAEPVSLHPIIDPAICVGCGSCVRACPEQPEHMVLG